MHKAIHQPNPSSSEVSNFKSFEVEPTRLPFEETRRFRLATPPPTIDIQLDPLVSSGWGRILDEERLAKTLETDKSPRIIIAPLTVENVQKSLADKNNAWILEPISAVQNHAGLGFHSAKHSNVLDEYVWINERTIVLKENVSHHTLRANEETLNNNLDAMRRALRLAYKALDIPYIHLWYYPEPVPSVFLFRVDVDYVVSEALSVIRELSRKYSIRGTYFINVSGEEEFEDEIGQGNLERATTPDRSQSLIELIQDGNEVANHGFWHQVYPTKDENEVNIERAQTEIMTYLKIECAGFAAPGAESTVSLSEALKRFNFLYVANTLADRGSLPYRPSQSGPNRYLEIPGCAVSDLSLEGVERDHDRREIAQDITTFYGELISAHQETGMPVCLIAHPHLAGQVGTEFFEPIFQAVTEAGLKSITHLEFAKWWKKRAESSFEVSQGHDGNLEICSSLDSAVIEILYRGERQLVKLTPHKD